MEIDVEHVTKLANLPLNEKSLEILGKQLTETLLYIDRLNEIPTEKVEPTSQVTGLTNITRDDTVSVLLDDSRLVQQLRAYLKRMGYQHGPLFRAEKNWRGGPLRYQSIQER